MHSSSLFESVFNHAPIGNYLLSPTPEAIVLAVNDAFLAASGRTREEMVGVSLFTTFPADPNDPTDDSETVLRASLMRAVASGKPDSLPTVRYPIPVTQADGSVRFEERFWNAISTPLFDADGRILCVSHSTSDITEQVRAAAALRESEKRFRALTDAAADVVYTMSPDWSEMHQLDGRGFLKDTGGSDESWLDDYIPSEERVRVRQAIDTARRNKAVFELEHKVLRADGSCGWTLSRAVPMLDAEGEIYEWIGAANDVTERRETEEKLRQADRHKDEFLAMLAHELRNPLAPLGAAAQLLQMGKPDEARVRHTSQIIARQVLHMTHLIDDLLDVSRVTNGLVSLDKAPAELNRILAEAVEQVTPLMRARAHDFSCEFAPGTVMVDGDSKRLVQVVANILNNAAKYTPEGGTVSLVAEADAREIRITVTDNGIGMAPQLAARAFDLFAQAERSPDRSSGGLGLGLALVRSLVELHGGSVACDSAGEGQGSRFTVRLPRLPAGEGPAQPEASGGVAHDAGAALRIMVVDDNVDAASMLAMLLEIDGHEVAVEHHPHPALARARAAPPHVCLLDIGLPDMDGKELAQRLRAQPETAHSLLVAITGYGQDSDRACALDAGFDHYLVKPIDTAKLGDILAEAGAAA
ncbi:response regulator [Massilia sp. IC2-278]|uniref:PAS domain-containing hybrid sensor histidine kinase/response regulator n=1 Tax=Massilia sp. IC2-278 TaxID=2887200 RepID=UPI001E50AE54|nr:ATP-binding protein [Massilia sp. IC2-278]MCC2959120.1 response regulator [Massilia sp. IC2-278]